jgi:hypothetical protein
MERRVRRARTGLIVSSIVGLGAGAALVVGSQFYVGNADFDFGPNIAMGAFGLALLAGGIVWVGVYGKRLRTAKRELTVEQADKPRSQRIEWDPHTSRFVL